MDINLDNFIIYPQLFSREVTCLKESFCQEAIYSLNFSRISESLGGLLL